METASLRKIGVIFPLLLLGLFGCDERASDETIKRSVEELRLAMLNPETGKLNRLAAPSLSYGHSGGVIEDKRQFIESLVSRKYKFLKIELSDQTITVLNNVAIVRHKLSALTYDEGKPQSSIKLGVLLVWLKINDAWQLTARQSFKL
jgi:hypothetical protein